ncbi:MAG: hypothetical protein AB7K24_33130 [Gemmataceae bacterium]
MLVQQRLKAWQFKQIIDRRQIAQRVLAGRHGFRILATGGKAEGFFDHRRGAKRAGKLCPVSRATFVSTVTTGRKDTGGKPARPMIRRSFKAAETPRRHDGMRDMGEEVRLGALPGGHRHYECVRPGAKSG